MFTLETFVTEDYGKICYGATKDSAGLLKLRTTGTLVWLKLIHVSGYLTCNKYRPEFKSQWGCNTGAPDDMTLATVVTTNDNHVILPKPGATKHNENWFYKLPSFDVNSPEIRLMDKSLGIRVFAGEVLKIMYGEDWKGVSFEDNEGTHCVRVIAKFDK